MGVFSNVFPRALVGIGLCVGAIACGADAQSEDVSGIEGQTAAVQGQCNCDVETSSVTTPTGTDTYRVSQVAVLDAPAGAAWAQLGDLKRFFEVALGPSAQNLRWAIGDGRSVGDELNFELNGATIRLVVAERNPQARRFSYRFIQPALGIESILSTITLSNCGNRSRFEWVRDFRMAPGESFDALSQIVVSELQSVVGHFAADRR